MYLLDVMARNSLMPIRTTGAYSFCRNRRTSFPDIVNVNRRMRQRWRSSSVMGILPLIIVMYCTILWRLGGKERGVSAILDIQPKILTRKIPEEV